MYRTAKLLSAALLSSSVSHAAPASDLRAQIVIYGCTPAGITAAIAAKRREHDVALACRDGWIGGLSTNGLGYADAGNHHAIGGLALQFYKDVKSYYAERGITDIPAAQAHPGSPNDVPGTQWVFEPHVAEAIYQRWLDQHGIVPIYNFKLRLDQGGVVSQDGKVREMVAEDGRKITGDMFIDASYEGDLMAMAGVSFTTGREANAQYGETLNGNQPLNSVSHNFTADVDPYIVPGKPESGLLPRIEPGPAGVEGAGDKRIQAYTYRLCMTKRPDIRAPFPKPANYDPLQYELLARYYDTGWRDPFTKYDAIPNGKTDTNNFGAFSFDNIGMNYGYPTGSYAERERIVAEHRDYQQGLLWFMQNDPRVPADVRAAMAPWGLCGDEFKDNGHWPREIYMREARRMVSDFVMAEKHLRGLEPTPQSVGLGSYNMDSHNVRRYVDARGFARNEGNIEVSPGRDYEISYLSLVPRRNEARNLLVPAAISASHIAYGSIRMEPVFMILGESAGTAASLALRSNSDVQDVRYDALEPELVTAGQVLHPDSTVARYYKKIRRKLASIYAGLTD
ncbi:FAD-dependent oxidoreductase [Phyllobacterium leguminum]|uniref:FAD dependent oxidoreductase n=1 Tax=Phyllobacterium leguminum TaxID=314237 RepID=A0A318TFS5_9HYPH|nr:FAD-dependent oxidoreductase [Phyllobacterium leguminum]PYE87392.1 FAD dependent oxidoreductase [Phyllobacterium leguminum]